MAMLCLLTAKAHLDKRGGKWSFEDFFPGICPPAAPQDPGDMEAVFKGFFSKVNQPAGLYTVRDGEKCPGAS